MEKIIVCEVKTYEDEWPSNLLQFISFLTEKAESIPTEYRKSAIINFDLDGIIDPYMVLRIFYFKTDN